MGEESGVTGQSVYADEPRRWLVVYNSAVDGAAAWAEHYRAGHAMPQVNLLGLPLSLDEVISEAAYLALAEAIEIYLDQSDLAEQVLGILCGHGVPGGFVRDATGDLESVAAHLHRVDGATSTIDNPVGEGPLERPSAANLGGRAADGAGRRPDRHVQQGLGGPGGGRDGPPAGR